MRIKLYYDINDSEYYNIIINNNKIVDNKKLIEKQLLN